MDGEFGIAVRTSASTPGLVVLQQPTLAEKGVPAVYCSENSSLAALEIIASLTRPSTLPSYRILGLDVPDGSIAVAPSSIGDTRQAGAEMLQTRLAIMAPSFVNPLERNVVINPDHPDFDKVLPGMIRPFAFDRRRMHP